MSTGINFFRKIQSEFDLNGPTLNMQTQPVGTSCSVASGIATFIGIGTAIYPFGQAGRKTNSGQLVHKWHKVGVGELSDSTNIIGSGTTTLTLNGLTFNDNNSQYFCRVDYIPNELSPNAINDPFDSASANLQVFPIISIVNQPQNVATLQKNEAEFDIDATISDNTNFDLNYQWVLDGVDLNDGTTSEVGVVSGSKTKTLKITRDVADLYKVFCKVSHPKALPGIVTSNVVNLDVILDRAIINYERYGGATNTVVESSETDISQSGAISFRSSLDIDNRDIVFYAPERDIDVKITMGGASGSRRSNTFQTPGEGGISVFKTTLRKNDEYVVKLGVSDDYGGSPRGGLSNGGGGGGGAAALYHKGKLIAVCGGGGGSGTNGGGGDGGGLQVAGQNGSGGSGQGSGGDVISQGQLPIGGMTQAGRTGQADYDSTSTGGGRIGACTVGNYYYDQGFAPCEDVGVVQFRNASGVINTESSFITRGYKSGQGFINNGGASGGSLNGGGGAGANGGTGGTNNGAGGGGASGYSSDEVELLSSSVLEIGTRVGGNNNVAFIAIEAFVSGDDHVPFIPPPVGTPLRTIQFSIYRDLPVNNTIVFKRNSGSGPERIQFGPNSGTNSVQMSSDAVYNVISNDGTLRRSPNGVSLELNNINIKPIVDFDKTQYGLYGFGQADVDELLRRGYVHKDIEAYVAEQRLLLGAQFGTGADAWLASMGKGNGGINNFDPSLYGGEGISQEDIDELIRRGHNYSEIVTYVDEQRIIEGNKFGTGADEWLNEAAVWNAAVKARPTGIGPVATDFDPSQYGTDGLGLRDELWNRGHNYTEIKNYVLLQRDTEGEYYGTGADVWLAKGKVWYDDNQIRIANGTSNGRISTFDPAQYGAFGFGPPDVEELQRRGHNYLEIKGYIDDQRQRIGSFFGTGADSYLNQASQWYSSNLNNASGNGTITTANFDKTQYGRFGFGQADINELVDRGHNYNEIYAHVISQRQVLGAQFGTGADNWLTSVGPGAGTVLSFDPAQYGAFGFGQPDVDELLRRGHNYNEIRDYVNFERLRNPGFGTGADEWLTSLGSGNGVITTANFDKTQYGPYGFGQADVDELIRRGHNYVEINNFVIAERLARGDDFGTGIDEWLTYNGPGSGEILDSEFDPTIYGAFGFGMADINELIRRQHNYDEIYSYVLKKRQLKGEEFVAGAEDWIQSLGVGSGQITTENFDKTQFGLFGFGMADIRELIRRKHNYLEINAHVLDQRQKKGAEFGTGADDWLISIGVGVGASVGNFDKTQYGAFGFGQADVDELWDRGHSYTEITTFVDEQRIVSGAQFGTGADEWIVSLGSGNGAITDQNFDKTQFGLFGFGQADVDELIRRRHNYLEINKYVQDKRTAVPINPDGSIFGSGADAYLRRAAQWYQDNVIRIATGTNNGKITIFDKEQYGVYGFGQKDVDELLRRGFNYLEINQYVLDQRVISGNKFGTGADAWLVSLGPGNGAITDQNFDKTQYGAYGFGQPDVDELIRRGHNYLEINQYVIDKRVALGAQFGTGADAWLARAAIWYSDNQTRIANGTNNGAITNFDPTQYGLFGFGQADVDQLLFRGHNYPEIQRYVTNQRFIQGHQFGTGADSWLAQAERWYQDNQTREANGASNGAIVNFDQTQYGAYGFGQPDVDELLSRGHNYNEINNYVIEQRRVKGNQFGTGADDWLISVGPGAGNVLNFDQTLYGAFGFGQPDVDELWSRGHSYAEIKTFVDAERVKIGNQFGTGANIWLAQAKIWYDENQVRIANGNTNGAVDPNYDPSTQGAFGFGQPDVDYLLSLGHNYNEIKTYVDNKRTLKGNEFGTGADAWLAQAKIWYDDNQIRIANGTSNGPVTNFDKTQFGLFGFGQADIDELIRRKHNYDEINDYVIRQREVLGAQFGTGADAWLDQASQWSIENKARTANGQGNGRITNFDPSQYGAFGFGQRDVDELLNRGHNYDEIRDYVIEQRSIKGAQFGTGADAWLNSNSPSQNYFNDLIVTPNIGLFVNNSRFESR